MASANISSQTIELAKNIELLILDVDGVLTNGELFYSDIGDFKAFHARDGLGIALLTEVGIQIAIISGNQSEAVEKRFKKFGLKHVYQGVADKGIIYENLKKELSITDSVVAYMGDDLIDLPVMTKVALPTAVADADQFVKNHAQWVSQYNGGQGAVRELCELILEAKGLLANIKQSYVATTNKTRE